MISLLKSRSIGKLSYFPLWVDFPHIGLRWIGESVEQNYPCSIISTFIQNNKPKYDVLAINSKHIQYTVTDDAESHSEKIFSHSESTISSWSCSVTKNHFDWTVRSVQSWWFHRIERNSLDHYEEKNLREFFNEDLIY